MMEVARLSREVLMNSFGAFIKDRRIKQGITLREFCQQNGFDPGNYSKLERGMFPPPREEKVREYARALQIREGSDDWITLFDLAAVGSGQIPKDVLDDKELVSRLPVLCRTIGSKQMSPEKLDALIEKIRRS
jgi:transcriptional regulator with XRE-family HTH domain